MNAIWVMPAAQCVFMQCSTVGKCAFQALLRCVKGAKKKEG